ncbi:MAG: hypothetical protein ABIH86_02000 [Planctomycetota bacterium]
MGKNGSKVLIVLGVIAAVAIPAVWLLIFAPSSKPVSPLDNVPAPSPSMTAVGTPDSSSTGLASPPPAEDNFVVLVVEAESGQVDQPFVVRRMPGASHISGGACVELPEKVNPTSGYNNIQTSSGQRPVHPGQISVLFNIPQAGNYYLHARMEFPDGCADSALFKFSGSDLVFFTSGSYRKDVFRWFSPQRSDGQSIPIRLEAGRSVLNLLNSEDGIKADQFILTTNPRYTPPDSPVAP